ncbi:hypothetical protein [Thermoflavimicrobium daqui]|jgi:hypothetical protein|uniref:Uncharacterized protein n=1 Tax=Thermoflavimicrobium daqui TaxID=2137476 RepID=A0A364K7U8_9BACL|nr:hypothetical protein [Thermoflavimicrobium daqui]RAL26302.1 hypothetical protein DL897_04720 [Thermoflavimicrobium daqui]
MSFKEKASKRKRLTINDDYSFDKISISRPADQKKHRLKKADQTIQEKLNHFKVTIVNNDKSMTFDKPIPEGTHILLEGNKVNELNITEDGDKRNRSEDHHVKDVIEGQSEKETRRRIEDLLMELEDIIEEFYDDED